MPIENPYYSAAVHGDFALADIGDLVLEEGATLRGCQLAYQTLGTLNAAKDNAVLITTWYSGNHSVMRDTYVGAGRAIDPAEHFVVLVNQIGSGLGHLSAQPGRSLRPVPLPAGPHRGRRGGPRAADARGARRRGAGAGLRRLDGRPADYEWAVRFPDKVKRAAPLAGTARIYQHCVIWAQTLVDALTSDPGYAGGWYHESADVRGGLQRHAGLFALHVLSNDFWTGEHWRALGFSSPEDFVIGFLEGYFEPMDAGDLLAQAWKWQHGDVSRHTGGDLAAALGRITAKTVVMPVSTDKFFPPEDCAAEQELVPNSEFRVIEDVHGHASLFGLSPAYVEQVDDALRKLLQTQA